MFSISIFCDTFFGNNWPSILLAFGGVLFFAVRTFFKKERSRGGKILLSIFLGCSLAGFSVSRKNARYSATQSGVEIDYLGSGQITEIQGNGRYIIEDRLGREYVYYSSQAYLPGQKLLISAGVKLASGVKPVLDGISLELLQEKTQKLTDSERGFDSDKRMIMRGYAGSMYEKHANIIGNDGGGVVMKVRGMVKALIGDAYQGKVKGLTLGMLIGERSSIPHDDYKGFISSGLVHLVAVSGGNMVLVISAFSLLLFFLPYYIRVCCCMIAVVVYALVCGLDSSVIRASVMSLLTMGALFAGRSINVWRSMSYVYVAMLLRNPYYLLYDIGFVFSFSALGSLVYFSQGYAYMIKKRSAGGLKERSVRIVKSLRNSLVVPSTAASIGIFAPLLFFAGSVNMLSILSNMLVAPLAPFVMIYGFLSSIIYSVTLWGSVTLPQKRAISRIYEVSERTNAHRIVISAQTGWARIAVVLIALGVVAAIYIIKQRKK